MPTLKQLLTALALTIVTFGSSHLLVSYFLMVTRDYQEGNLFRILNYQKLVPGLDIGMTSFIIGNIIAVGVYFIFLAFVLHRSKKPKTDKEES